jgi:preprotein translocase subunit SecA
LNEYKSEAFALFERMLVTVREDVTRMLALAQFQMQPESAPALPGGLVTTHIDPFTGENDAQPVLDAFGSLPPSVLAGAAAATAALSEIDEETRAEWLREVPRNAPCPCGSGKKFKHCHGVL